MNRLQEKYSDFKNAVARLGGSIGEYERFPNTTMRDGVIQRFEFTEELAWKTAKVFLEDQGFTELNSPKTVMKQAFKYGLITNV
ncbi:MAG: nucleotidyltransferase substrate binding protein [Acidobacteria bacterium]|nr:nucleotidyltransferase substrate binding protein [Acidobacteriota bacterium]